MDFVSGALPNVMFLVGMIAIGIGLGIEFKIVEVKGQLSKNGRIAAFSVGALLIAVSIGLYIRPATPTASALAVSPTVLSQAQSVGGTDELPAPSTVAVTAQPEAVAVVASPTPMSEPTAAIVSTTVPTVSVPDLTGMSLKDAEQTLTQRGLQLGDKKGECAELGLGEAPKGKKGRIVCQLPATSSAVIPGTRVDYVLR